MFKVGDIVERIGFTIESRDMYRYSEYEVSVTDSHDNHPRGTIQLVGLSGIFHTARFVIAKPKQNCTVPWVYASDYMDNTNLDEEDKRVIGEALCLG